MKLTISELIERQANQITSGKTLPRVEGLKGALEFEVASQMDRNEAERDLDVYLPNQVNVGYDCSIETSREYAYDNEVRVKFDNLDKDIPSIKQIVDRLAQYSVVNSSCGMHIHLNLQALVGGDLRNATTLRRAQRLIIANVSTCARFVNAFYGIAGARKRNESEYARPFDSFDIAKIKEIMQTRTLEEIAYKAEKYRMMNPRNVANDSYIPSERTLEYRFFSMDSGINKRAFRAPDVAQLELNLFVLVNLISCARFNATQDISKLRFDAKHPKALDSFKWFIHHCAKRPQIAYFQDINRVKRILQRAYANCQSFDNA